MRRLVHLLILVVIVIGIRLAGPYELERGLAESTSWIAEKTGIARAREAWAADIQPWLARAMRSVSDSVARGLTSASDRAESRTRSAWASVWNWVKAAVDFMTEAVGSLFGLEDRAPPLSPAPTVSEPEAPDARPQPSN